MTILSIDPGKSGGIAWWHEEDLGAFPMPNTQGDIVGAIRSLVIGGDSVAYLEQVPKHCGPKLPASSVFVMAENFGFVKGVLMALAVRVVMVTPQAWQAEFSLGRKADCASKSEWKNKAKARAQELYPALDITLSTSDAVLILEYGRRQEKGNA